MDKAALDSIWGNEVEFLDKAMQTVTLDSGERIHLFGHSLNKIRHQLRLFSRDANQNFCLIRDVLELVNETGLYAKVGLANVRPKKRCRKRTEKDWRLPVTL